jgi:hypothetical protein
MSDEQAEALKLQFGIFARGLDQMKWNDQEERISVRLPQRRLGSEMRGRFREALDTRLQVKEHGYLLLSGNQETAPRA